MRNDVRGRIEDEYLDKYLDVCVPVVSYTSSPPFFGIQRRICRRVCSLLPSRHCSQYVAVQPEDIRPILMLLHISLFLFLAGLSIRLPFYQLFTRTAHSSDLAPLSRLVFLSHCRSTGILHVFFHLPRTFHRNHTLSRICIWIPLLNAPISG
jgi:hypothetical protein